MRRIVVLDFYRFIAAYSVAFLHILEFSNNGQLRLIIDGLAYFVDFFFILSGFVVGANYFDKVATLPDIINFLQKRIARIYPLYLATTFCFLSVFLLGISSHPQGYQATSIVAQIFMVQQWQLNPYLPLNFPAWSISAEWAMYLVFPLLVATTRALGIQFLILMAAISSLAIWWLIKTGDMHTPVWSALRAAPTFIIGVIISRLDLELRHGQKIGAVFFLASIFLMFYYAQAAIVISCFSLCIAFTAADTEPSKSGTLEVFGNLSYAIYMLHSFFYAAAFRFIKTGIDPTILGVIISFIVILASIPTFYLFEAPARKLLSRRYCSLPLITPDPETETYQIPGVDLSPSTSSGKSPE